MRAYQIALQSRGILFLLVIALSLLQCNQYGLLDKLENPGGKSSSENASGCTNNGTGIVKTGLMGFWNLNGNLNDKWDCGSGIQVGSGSNFAFVTDRFGTAGNAMNLAVSTGLVSLGNLPAYESPQFTMCSWLRLTTGSTTMPVVRKHDGTNGWKFQIRDVTASADFAFGNTFYVSTGTGMTVGSWYYVCMVADTTVNPSIIGYVGLYGSSLISSQYAAIASFTGNASNLELNATGGSGGAVEFDDVVFYNRALNSAEIQQNYTAIEQ